jgi:hypothetical protein
VSEPRATVIIPTHNHDLTLPITVAGVLGQTVSEFEVLIVGDGVTDELRATAENLARTDERIRFLDLPKGEHHGEIHRDLAVREARSNAIFYLCDDDLLLPRHIENLLPLLADHDLVQCRNGHITPAGELVLYPTDLSDPVAVRWHLEDPPRNCISLTGTAHRRDSYLALDEGWTVTPDGYWPDHYMWRKLLRSPTATAATHPDMTAIQLPTGGDREMLGQPERAAELQAWADRLLGDPNGHAWLQAEVERVTPAQLNWTHRDHHDAAAYAATLAAEINHRDAELRKRDAELNKQQARLDALISEARTLRATGWEQRAQLIRSRARVARLQQQLHIEQAEVAALRGSRSWKLTAPLRAAGLLARRLRSR